MNDKTVRREIRPDGTEVKVYAKSGFTGQIREHAAPLIVTAVVTVVGGLIWAGGLSYLDTRHLQRHEAIEQTIGANNREIRKLEAYNSVDTDGARAYRPARDSIIAELRDENDELKRTLERMKNQ